MSEAVLAQLFAIKAQVDAMIVLVQSQMAAPPVAAAAPVDSDACPQCGASGDTQHDTTMIDGSKQRHCLKCHAVRVL